LTDQISAHTPAAKGHAAEVPLKSRKVTDVLDDPVVIAVGNGLSVFHPGGSRNHADETLW
jgi:hypothetical protein